MTDVATLALKVDAAEVKSGTVELDKLTAAGGRAEKKGHDLNASFTMPMVKVASANMEEMSSSVQRLIGRYDPLGAKLRSLESDFAMLNKAAAGGQIGVGHEGAVDKTYAALNAEIAKTKGLMATAGIAMDGAASSTATLGLSSQYARRELMMLGREALTGDFSRMPQTFGSLIAHSNLLSLAMNPIAGTIAGIVAAVGALTYVIHAGNKEFEAMSDALNKTNNYAGQTISSMSDMASAISKSSNTTVGKVADIEVAIARSGRVGEQAFASAAEAAVKYAEAGGISADKAAEFAVKMFSDPIKFAEELNMTMGYLTAEQLLYIKGLQDSGDYMAAGAENARLLREEYEKHPPQLSAIEELLISGKKAWSEYWGATTRFVSRNATFQEQLDALNKAIEIASKPNPLFKGLQILTGTTGFSPDQQLIAQRDELIRKEAEKNSQAMEDSAQGAIRREQQLVLQMAETRSEYAKRLKLDADLMRERKQYAEIEKAIASTPIDKRTVEQADHLRILGEAITTTEKQIADLGKAKTKSATQQLAYDIDAIKKNAAEAVGIYSTAASIMQARHAARLIDDKSYYLAQVAFIQMTSSAKEEELQKEIVRYKVERDKKSTSAEQRIDLNRKILDSESELRKVREDAVAKIEIEGIKEAAAIDKVAQAYATAQKTARDYLATVARKNERDLAGIGMGVRFRTDQSSLNAIEDKQRNAIDALDARRATMKEAMTQKMYDNEKAIIESTYAAEIALSRDKTAKVMASEQDWVTGAKEAMSNYAENARNVAKQTEDLFTRAFKGMEDALVNFVKTGKLDFRSLADSIVSDIIRIQVRQGMTAAMGGGSGGGFLGDIFGSIFGGGGGATSTAIAGGAGNFSASQLAGPILSSMIPGYADGTDYVPYDMVAKIHKGEKIVPAAENNGSKTVTVINNFTVPQPTDRRTQEQIAAMAGASVQHAMMRNA